MNNYVKPIPRWKRLEMTLNNFREQGPFSTFDQINEAFIVTFDNIEISVSAHNKKVKPFSVDEKEATYMSVPSAIQHSRHKSIYFALATGHIILFTEWGSFAIYHRIEGVFDELELYKESELSKPLFMKASACKRNIWGEHMPELYRFY